MQEKTIMKLQKNQPKCTKTKENKNLLEWCDYYVLVCSTICTTKLYIYI
jgi:hypothetical protein